MNSCIYIGYIEHRRFSPAVHHFRYPLYFYCFDLDELEALDHALPLFGYNRLRPTSLYDEDYLSRGKGAVREKLFRFLEKGPFLDQISKVMLITSARYLNYIFNPVSFYYCLSAERKLLCVLAEVNNTFGEKHLYILRKAAGESGGYLARYSAEKSFHVSPFNNMKGQYEFLFSDIGKELDIRISLYRDDEKIFEGQLWGQSGPLTAGHHAWTLLKHPLIPLLTMPRIIFEAARLHFLRRLQYYEKPVPISPMTIRKNLPTMLQKFCMNMVMGLLDKIAAGGITMLLPDGHVRTFGDTLSSLQGKMIINDYSFFRQIAIGGDVALGESFTEGVWDTDDVTTLFKVFIRNRDTLLNGYPATAWLSRLKNRLLHYLRENTLIGSVENIGHHYDLSNDFFRLFLDTSMTYSCGIYQADNDTLEDAQKKKHQTIINKARILESDHVLEIGCGWGSFAIEAVQRTGCSVTGITNSKAQYQYATERVKEANLEHRIAILLKDYREIEGNYDKIVSIEMLEALGHRYYGKFFKCCERLLKSGGLFVAQVITIPDQRYENYRKETDWIQEHIFPGGLLPSLFVLSKAAAEHSTLLIENLENIGVHYARTLRDWRERFHTNLARIAAQGFDRNFQRKWTYYFSICEAGFAEKALGDLVIVFVKPA